MTRPDGDNWFCTQCWGKGWVRIEGRLVECINYIMRRRPAPDPEHRGDRPYDEQDASKIVTPHGIVASFDRAFCGAAMRALLDGAA